MKAVMLNNRYRIIKTLGRGGFGETYLTEDTHMPSGRKCVLKQLKPIVKQPKTPLWMKERFQREAAILEELGENSNQIPQLYAYFSEDGKFYLVQEWIEGLTLDQYWEREGNLHRDEVRQILLQLLPVLNYVHSRRIIHRDIKPENIILRQGDNLPFLIDFGAVKEAMATEINQNSNSTYSASIGTPGYMSSEQAAGRPIYSSDLYSLGLTAIFLLTGKSPNELETNPRTGEIIWQEHAFNLDPKLAAVIDQAIRFHPRDRFATAQEMLVAINSGLNAPRTTHPTGATLNLAPRSNSASEQYISRGNKHHTIAMEPKGANKPKKRGLLANVALFMLIAIGIGAGTFAAGFAVISSLLRSPETSTQQAEVKPPTRTPDLFPTIEKQDDINQKESDQKQAEADKKEVERNEAAKNAARRARLRKIAAEIRKKVRNSEPETTEEQPEVFVEEKPPKKLAKIELEPASTPETEISIPILTTGTSESQLMSTLGEPNSTRRGWRPNSQVLVYYDVVPDQANISYQSDDTGKIRQTDVALNQSVSLGAMQQTLAKMLGGNAPAGVKEKLRSVYDRQANFSFFKVSNLEGKVQRDSKDRINISVWERGFQ
ncbi:serine/threonine-protein kinase [Pleurocapsa sp. PCC 7319]|uniref:serine/threonine-protein kinase n=1 Tax=Pleurocapsa sp. PCC 7319 TaxID=118161 RepID=UPI0003704E6A|nr:serine/threonine-protein kinase [Pleurocapsa sp. PCC 7319]